ncbi:uncharacterized protein LOC124271316 [Haliotis rubra]|uniref:uncharacterized protein LOC124271316 n=1 Tax=Haliotis rubra TaxID=36100 RepID=UPI001EE4F973|nr:uncharacterized protein LOC124271316 [Haliotis rubra]
MKFLVVCAVVLTSALVHGQEAEEDAVLFPESEDDDLELENLEDRVAALEDNITVNEMLSVEVPSLAMEVEKMNHALKKMDDYIDKLYKYTKGIKKEIQEGKEDIAKSVKANQDRIAKLPRQIEDLKKDIENKEDKHSPEETEKYLRGLWTNWKEGKFGVPAEQPKKEELTEQVTSPAKNAWRGLRHHQRRGHTRHVGGHSRHGGGGGGAFAWTENWLAKKKQEWQQKHQEKPETEDTGSAESEPRIDNTNESADEEQNKLIFR